MLDWPAFGNALWLVNDQLGIRPEWQLPVIYLETAHTFDPSIVNPGGCVGINQLCPSTYSKYVHVPVDQYRAWPASKQLSGPVFAYWRDALTRGPINSAARLMLAQLGQGLLASAPDMNSVVFSAPSAGYQQNKSFDQAGKGYFTVQDLANAVAKNANAPAVQDAIARAYAMRPGNEIVTPPSVQRGSAKTFLLSLTAGALIAASGYGIYKALGPSGYSDEPEPPYAFRRRP